MAETKRKKTLASTNSLKRRKGGGKEKNWKKGPHLPNALQKELNSLNPTDRSDEEIHSDDDIDVYEYEENIPEEESKKNRRYDPVDNFEYELPKDFEDEDVASDDDEEEKGSHSQEGGDSDGYDEEKHARMLQDITGLPGDAFEGKKKKKDVIFEAYPESEYNPSRDVLDGDGHITVDDLLNPLHGKPGFSKIRKDVQRMDKKSMSIQPPLPKPQQQKIDRRSAYVYSKKKLHEYEALVKKNREAPTIYFDEDIDVGYSTVGAIASEFRPRTEFEKKMDSLINGKELSEAHKGDGARLLELNKVSLEDVKERQDRLSKMRNLLFRHELKAKRIKHIKSKTYRRLLKKDKSKATEIEMNSEAAKELAEKEEFKRAEERMTLKHKNTSKWAKRIKKRGVDVQDDGTRAAISEQLQQHALLTRKRNSMHDDESSSDDSTEDDDDDDDDDISGDGDDASKLKLLENGKNRTLEVLGEDDEDMPKSGVLSLPFMVRGQKKKKEAAEEEARLAFQDYDSSLKQLDGDEDFKDNVGGSLSGRKVYGAQKKQVPQSKKKVKANTNKDNYFDNTDSEDADDEDTMVDVNDKHGRMDYTQKDVNIDPSILREESEIGHDPLFKNFDDIDKDKGPTIEYEVSLSVTNSLKKKRNRKDSNQLKGTKDVETKKSQVAEVASDIEEHDDRDDEGGMVDGIITSGTDYELPTQDDLIRHAFAGDDVEEDFEMSKQEILNEENPEPEKPVLLPGWGQWTHIQRKRGLPSWMLAEHERAKKKRDQDLNRRPDAHLKHVIISQKLDKKAEKLQTKVLPYPFKDKDHFERSNRMPLGPEFNPATTIASLNRPDVVKKSGVSIKPIKLRKHH